MTKKEHLLNVARAREIRDLANAQYRAAVALAFEAGCQSRAIGNAALPLSETRE